jgi:hypothetical protein
MSGPVTAATARGEVHGAHSGCLNVPVVTEANVKVEGPCFTLGISSKTKPFQVVNRDPVTVTMTATMTVWMSLGG